MTAQNVVKSHTHRTGEAALPAAYQQRRENYYHISEMYVHIREGYKKYRKRYVAERSEKRCKCNVKYFLMCCFHKYSPFSKKVLRARFAGVIIIPVKCTRINTQINTFFKGQFCYAA